MWPHRSSYRQLSVPAFDTDERSKQVVQTTTFWASDILSPILSGRARARVMEFVVGDNMANPVGCLLLLLSFSLAHPRLTRLGNLFSSIRWGDEGSTDVHRTAFAVHLRH